mmetsp:Transcript_21979/g.36023  ORF Transcript_21979/g.36023 Transcript_21979/m.36023 type:complete len:114 (-) Transcript_21979:56-397(-)
MGFLTRDTYLSDLVNSIVFGIILSIFCTSHVTKACEKKPKRTNKLGEKEVQSLTRDILVFDFATLICGVTIHTLHLTVDVNQDTAKCWLVANVGKIGYLPLKWLLYRALYSKV